MNVSPLVLADDLEKNGRWQIQVADCIRAMVASKSLPDPHMIVEVVVVREPAVLSPPASTI